MTNRSIISLLLLSILITLSQAADKCPFSDSCTCTLVTSGPYDYDSIDCLSDDLPRFSSIGTNYATKSLTLISDKVSNIQNNYFSIFTKIDRLNLRRNSTTGTAQANFGYQAFDGPKILAIAFYGLTGLLQRPVPTALHTLGQKGLESLAVTKSGDVWLNVDMLADFSTLVELSIVQTQINTIDQSFFTRNLYGLQKLTLSQVGFDGLPRVLDNNQQVSSAQQFTGLSYLNLSGNKMTNLSANCFSGDSSRGYASMDYLDLSGSPIADLITNNRLGTLSSKMRTLILNGIGLTATPTNFFTSGTLAQTLTKLDLTNNGIETIHANDYALLAYLETLILDGNPLITIEANSFGQYGALKSISAARTNMVGANLVGWASTSLALTDVNMDGCANLVEINSSIPYGGRTYATIHFRITNTGLRTVHQTTENIFYASKKTFIDISHNTKLQCAGIDWIKQWVDAQRISIDGTTCDDMNHRSLADYLASVTTPPSTTRATTTASTKGSERAIGSLMLVIITILSMVIPV